MEFIFRTADIKKMIEHWLATPPNGYIGVSYGRNPRQLLQRPMSDDTADTLLQWMREDIPVLKMIDDSELYIGQKELNFESKQYFIVIGTDSILIKTENAEKIEV